MKIWKVILAALVIFGAGAVTGALSVKLTSPQPAPSRKTSSTNWPPRSAHGDFVDRMQRELNLTASQRTRVEQLLAESQDRVKKLCDSINPQVHEEYRKVRETIRGELTPEQQQKYEEVFKRRSKGGKPRENGADSKNTKPSSKESR